MLGSVAQAIFGNELMSSRKTEANIVNGAYVEGSRILASKASLLEKRILNLMGSEFADLTFYEAIGTLEAIRDKLFRAKDAFDRD